MRALTTNKPKVLVVDEAHITTRSATYNIQQMCKWNGGDTFDKQMLMSADLMDDLHIKANRSVFIQARGKVPDIEWHVVRSDQKSYENLLPEVLLKHEKVAVVASGGYLEDISANAIPDIVKGKVKATKTVYGVKMFYQKTGVGTIPSFNAYKGRALLLLNSAQNKGINVHAEAVIIPDAGGINTTRVTQTIGRLARTGNEADVVSAYLYATNEHEALRCHYARCFYIEDRPFKIDKLPNLQYLRKCVSIMKMLGTSVETVNQVDGCVIFADTTFLLDGPYDLYKWWLDNRTEDSILSEDTVADLLCI